MRLTLRWLVNVGAIVLIVYLLPTVETTSIVGALIVGVVLAVLNTFVRAVFKVFALPLSPLTLGLFTFVVNSALVEILDWLLDSLFIRGLGWAILFALTVSIVAALVNITIGGSNGRGRRLG